MSFRETLKNFGLAPNRWIAYKAKYSAQKFNFEIKMLEIHSIYLMRFAWMREREKKWTEAADVYARERLCSVAPQTKI